MNLVKLSLEEKLLQKNYRRKQWAIGMITFWSKTDSKWVIYHISNKEYNMEEIQQRQLGYDDFYQSDIFGDRTEPEKKENINKENKMDSILKYSDEDTGKVFAKKSWGTNRKGTSGTMFTWNPNEKLYGYCKIIGGTIRMKEPTSKRNIIAGKTFSQVGQGVLDAELVEIHYDISKRSSEREILNNIQKGKKMSKKNTDKNEAARILIDALCLENAEEVIEKTDLESKSKYSMEVYGLEEEYITTLQLDSKKDAYKFLQHPQNLGKTIVIKKEIEVLTTNIPVINVTK